MSNRTKHVLACGTMMFMSIGLGLPATAQERSTISRVPSTIYLPDAAQAGPATPQLGGSGPGNKVRDISVLPNRKLDLGDAAASRSAAETKVQAFVAENARELGLDGNAAQLVVKDMRETLSGRYVSLEQKLDGIPIIDGHVQLTFSKDGTLQSVARNVVDVPTAAAARVNKAAAIDARAAEDIVWKDLGANGQLLEPPQADKAYLNENNVLTLVYIVKLAVSQPFGYWEYRIDANTGRIVSKRDRSIKEDKHKRALPPAEAAAAAAWPQPAPADRNVLLQDLQRRVNETKRVDKAAAKAAGGKGLIFEPNPVSTLNDANLKDGDPAAKFDKAYLEVTLEGLTEIGGTLHLQGPLVRIEDFEPGDGGLNRPPSTAVGQWTAKRGDNAFNDVMSYHHIHTSIRYLQKLGFQGAADLFPAGIAVDSDGLNGADNSHYVPGSDRLAFGHGCVDDNEDTDVILHELGHAIHDHINRDWGGGDSGAIGEGFGDYWALSQRIRMKNGLAVDVAKIFVWDGIDACWGGRRADRLNAIYDPGRSYGAHEDVGGFASDELWSTPLVSALFELVKAGETQDSVDQVVLEGMQGIGRDFTMRSLALATVAKAKTLFPGKPHAAVFEKHFRHHQIIN